MLRPFITLLIFCLSYTVRAQDVTPASAAGKLDSLWNVWNDLDQPDINRIKAIHQIAWDGYLFTQPDSAFYFAQLEYDLAKSINNKDRMARALSTQGAALNFLGDYEKAKEYQMKGLKINEEMGDKEGIANSLLNIGNIYANQGDYNKAKDYYSRSLTKQQEIDNTRGMAYSLVCLGGILHYQGALTKALENYSKSLAIYEEIGDEVGITSSLSNIGSVHHDQGNLGKAIEYYIRVMKMNEAAGNKVWVALSLNSIGNIHHDQGDYDRSTEYYLKSLQMNEEIGDKQSIALSLHNIGTNYHEEGDLVQAFEYYSKSLKLCEQIGDKKGVARTRINIGSMLLDQGDLDSALEYYSQGLSIYEEIGDKVGISLCMSNIGNIYYLRGEFEQARLQSDMALSIANEVGAVNEISGAAEGFYKSLKALGKHRMALEMYELYISTRDSILSEDNQKEIIRQEMKYEFEKAELIKEQQEKEARRLVEAATKRRDNLQYSIILIAILVLFGGVLMLGFISLSERMAEGIIFFLFLILFEFLLVLADPYIDSWSGGAPGIKLLFNAGIAALIFPAHAFFEGKLKGRLVKA